ncbi:MAG: ABC transporter ATP-binding protein [Bacilli bacterium]
MNIIEVNNLKKYYKNVKAVDDISFTVEKGSFFAFLGPNGAGKSTTINIIATLLEKTSGEVLVCNKEVGKNNEIIRQKIGVVFQKSVLDDLLTVKENLESRASFYSYSSKGISKKIDEVVKITELEPYLNRRYKTLSGGERRRIDIARALINEPDVLILDEPTTGLDPSSRKMIWNILNKLRHDKNLTIFLTTHYMEETLEADKVVILDHGKIVASGTPEYLRQKHSNDLLKITPKKDLLKLLDKDKVTYEKDRDIIKIRIEDSFKGLDIINKYKKYIDSFEIIRGNMDDVFLNITGRKLDNHESIM